MTPRPYNGDRPLESRVSVLEVKVEDIRKSNSDVMSRAEFSRAHELLDNKIASANVILADKIANVNKLAVSVLVAVILLLIAAMLAMIKH